jgi:hypothetical protein
MDADRVVIPADENEMVFATQTWFKLAPQKDITIEEISTILGLLQISIDKALYESLRDQKVVRHFQKIDG